jgi:glycosyltransferase involved in cell wall biosynthesis
VFRGLVTALIIPALDEEDTIGEVVAAVDREIVDRIIVADNDSRDATAERAAEAGATVVREPRRGYGSACLAAIRAAPEAEILVFLDGDGSDDPTEIPQLLAALLDTGADLAIGSRTLGRAEPGALTTVQRFGNALTCGLVRLFWGARFTDLGPFRAITREAYDLIEMSDPDFGWTIEMQVKAAQHRLATVEVPVSRRVRRGGESKVTGNVVGSYRAGKRILGYVAEAKLRELAAFETLRRLLGRV